MKILFSVVVLSAFTLGLGVGILLSSYEAHKECNKVSGFYVGSPYNCISRGE